MIQVKQLTEQQQIRLADIALDHNRLNRELLQHGNNEKQKAIVWNRLEELRAERTAILEGGK